MKPKLRILGTVKKDHLMEMQLHQLIDSRSFLFEFELHSLSYEPGRITLYSNQGNFLVAGKDRKILLIVDETEEAA